MLLIPCPWCGPRSEHEFICGGDATRKRPSDPNSLNEHEWSDYLHNNDNVKGWVRERWWHNKGCNTWFEIERNTLTHEIRELADND